MQEYRVSTPGGRSTTVEATNVNEAMAKAAPKLGASPLTVELVESSNEWTPCWCHRTGCGGGNQCGYGAAG